MVGWLVETRGMGQSEWDAASEHQTELAAYAAARRGERYGMAYRARVIDLGKLYAALDTNAAEMAADVGETVSQSVEVIMLAREDFAYRYDVSVGAIEGWVETRMRDRRFRRDQ